MRYLVQRGQRVNYILRGFLCRTHTCAELEIEYCLTFTKHIIGHIEPTNSTKALKEDRVVVIRLQSHQVHPTVLQ